MVIRSIWSISSAPFIGRCSSSCSTQTRSPRRRPEPHPIDHISNYRYRYFDLRLTHLGGGPPGPPGRLPRDRSRSNPPGRSLRGERPRHAGRSGGGLEDPTMGLSRATIASLIQANANHDCSDGGKEVCVRISAVADLPTRYGDFQVIAFDSPTDKKEHAALIRGDVLGQERVPVRLHSECLTGDAFTSLRCDCRQQLELALSEIGRRELGAILYLRQE